MTTPQRPGGRTRKIGLAEAAEVLADGDPVLAALVDEFGPPIFPKATDSHFAMLVRSVTYQQLAGAAARAIHGRLVATLDGDVSPERLLVTPTEALRAAGLSGNKAASLQDLATKVVDGTVVLDARRMARESDEEIISQLSTVRGIGRWSAEMFLMFRLRRPDVLPVDDLGIVNAIQRLYGLRKKPKPDRIRKIAESWRPYRTVACWYLWRSLENTPVDTPR
jgi:DNA-3-methyladenine glycosylase II